MLNVTVIAVCTGAVNNALYVECKAIRLSSQPQHCLNIGIGLLTILNSTCITPKLSRWYMLVYFILIKFILIKCMQFSIIQEFHIS